MENYNRQQHRDNIFWLDKLFHNFHDKDKFSLEHQMNVLSKSVLFIFCLLNIFYTFKISIAITISLLFIISIAYYILDFILQKKENFDVTEEDQQNVVQTNSIPSKPKKTSIDTFFKEKDTVFLHRKPLYSTILPLENEIMELNSKQLSSKSTNVSATTTYVSSSSSSSYPLKTIHQVDKIFPSDRTLDRTLPLNSFLQSDNSQSPPMKQQIKTDLFPFCNNKQKFVRNYDNIQHLPEHEYQSVRNSFLDNQESLSSLYNQALMARSGPVLEQRSKFPFHTYANANGSMSSNSSSSSYFGPRGNMSRMR